MSASKQASTLDEQNRRRWILSRKQIIVDFAFSPYIQWESYIMLQQQHQQASISKMHNICQMARAKYEHLIT